jgi:hypothetical protein
MRVLLLMLCFALTPSPASSRPLPDAPRPLALRSVLATSQFERNLNELRAAQSHSDHYLILRIEIEIMRRGNPEHSDFLDRYLRRLLQSER